VVVVVVSHRNSDIVDILPWGHSLSKHFKPYKMVHAKRL